MLHWCASVGQATHGDVLDLWIPFIDDCQKLWAQEAKATVKRMYGILILPPAHCSAQCRRLRDIFSGGAAALCPASLVRPAVDDPAV
jgi:hypothetical protein